MQQILTAHPPKSAGALRKTAFYSFLPGMHPGCCRHTQKRSYLSIYLPIYLFYLYLSVYLSIHLPTNLSMYLSRTGGIASLLQESSVKAPAASTVLLHRSAAFTWLVRLRLALKERRKHNVSGAASLGSISGWGLSSLRKWVSPSGCFQQAALRARCRDPCERDLPDSKQLLGKALE